MGLGFRLYFENRAPLAEQFKRGREKQPAFLTFPLILLIIKSVMGTAFPFVLFAAAEGQALSPGNARAKNSGHVPAQKSCCPRQGGGGMFAIHKAAKKSYKKSLASICSGLFRCLAWHRLGERPAKYGRGQCRAFKAERKKRSK